LVKHNHLPLPRKAALFAQFWVQLSRILPAVQLHPLWGLLANGKLPD
jgi:hypothetical protein